MNYSEQLKSPMWQKKRLKIMERDNFSCSCCKSNHKQLNVHHYKYKPFKMAWEYEDNMLTTLCDDCHKLIHSVQDSFNVDYLIIKDVCIKNNACCEMLDYMIDFGNSLNHYYHSLEDLLFDYIEHGAIVFESITENRTYIICNLEFDRKNKLAWIINFNDAK